MARQIRLSQPQADDGGLAALRDPKPDDASISALKGAPPSIAGCPIDFYFQRGTRFGLICTLSRQDAAPTIQNEKNC